MIYGAMWASGSNLAWFLITWDNWNCTVPIVLKHAVFARWYFRYLPMSINTASFLILLHECTINPTTIFGHLECFQLSYKQLSVLKTMHPHVLITWFFPPDSLKWNCWVKGNAYFYGLWYILVNWIPFTFMTS